MRVDIGSVSVRAGTIPPLNCFNKNKCTIIIALDLISNNSNLEFRMIQWKVVFVDLFMQDALFLSITRGCFLGGGVVECRQ